MSFAAKLREQLEGPGGEHAIRFEGRWRDRDWLRDRVAQLEDAIRATGVPDTAPVGFVPKSRPEFAAAVLAMFAYQRPIVMLYAYQSPEALAARYRELKLPVIVASDTQWTEETLQAAEATGSAAIALSLEDPGVTTLRPWAPGPGPEQAAPDAAPGVAILSSGTTGPPKHVHLSYEWLYERLVVNTAFAASGDTPMLSFFPLGNISGVYPLIPALASGHPIVMMEKFEVEPWVDFVRTFRPTAQNLPVAGLRMVLDAEVDPADLASLQSIATGATTLDPNLRREFEATFQLVVTQSYGATEFGGVVAIMGPEDRRAFGDAVADSVGRACSGAQLRVVDPDTGALLPPNTVGRLQVVAPGMEETGWLDTTDLALIDGDGFVFHRGRLDGVIVRGGFKLLPEQISNVLMMHPAIAAAAVVGLPDARLGMVPAALLELKVGEVAPSEGEIKAHVRARLPATYVPKVVRTIDHLPRTPSLKVDLTKVLAQFDATG